MERSQSGYIEPMTRGSRANAARVQAVIHAISDRFTGDPFPAMSEHYKPELDPEPVIVTPEPVRHGWNYNGEYE